MPKYRVWNIINPPGKPDYQEVEFPEDGAILSGLFGDLYMELFSKKTPRYGKSTVLYLCEHRDEKLKEFLGHASRIFNAYDRSFPLRQIALL